MTNKITKNDFKITLPVLNSLLHHTLEDDVYVDGESFELLLEIQRMLAVFEPIGDDEARMIWLEIPRGTAEEWKVFDDEHNWYSDPEDDNLASYQEALNDEYPYEKEWFFLVTSTYRENTFLKISDRDHRYVIFTNRHFREEAMPFVEDCDKEGELTRKQYDEIVRQAEWEPDVQLKLDGKKQSLLSNLQRGNAGVNTGDGKRFKQMKP